MALTCTNNKNTGIANRCNNNLVVFEDKQRTWVEITRNTARHRAYSSLLTDACKLLKHTEQFYLSVGTSLGGPPNVQFRILVASHFLDKKLGI